MQKGVLLPRTYCQVSTFVCLVFVLQLYATEAENRQKGSWVKKCDHLKQLLLKKEAS